MPLKIIAQDTFGGQNVVESNIEITDDAIIVSAAKRQGWKETIKDPEFQTNLDTLRTEMYSLPAGSDERKAKEEEVRDFISQGAEDVPNPYNAARFMIDKTVQQIFDFATDETIIEQAANEARNQAREQQKQLASQKIIITK